MRRAATAAGPTTETTKYQVALPNSQGIGVRYVTIADNDLAYTSTLMLLRYFGPYRLDRNTNEAMPTRNTITFKNSTQAVPYNVMMMILGFAQPIADHHHLAHLGNLMLRGATMITTSKHLPLLPRQLSLFSHQVCDVSHDVLGPLFCGDAETTTRMIHANYRYVLQKGMAWDLSRRKHGGETPETAVTPLQALVITGDTDLIPVVMEAFARIRYQDLRGTPYQHKIAADDASPQDLLSEETRHQIIQDQIKEILKRSLRVHLDRQEKEIVRLLELKANLPEDDAQHAQIDEKRNQARENVRAYVQALISENTREIFNIHQKAELDNVFNSYDAVTTAIEHATDTEIQAVFDDPDTDLGTPVSQAVMQCRAASLQHSHSELIVNRQHQLKIFELYDAFYGRVMNNDPDWKKRELFWCHLVGGEERSLAAVDAQIFANPGLYDAVENRATNARSFDFKYGGGTLFPPSFDPSSNSGVGYKFAGLGGLPARRGGPRSRFFKTYVEQKHQAWRTYAASASISCTAPVCNSVMR